MIECYKCHPEGYEGGPGVYRLFIDAVPNRTTPAIRMARRAPGVTARSFQRSATHRRRSRGLAYDHDHGLR